MEPSRFDELTKALATSTSRRATLRRIGGILGGTALVGFFPGLALPVAAPRLPPLSVAPETAEAFVPAIARRYRVRAVLTKLVRTAPTSPLVASAGPTAPRTAIAAQQTARTGRASHAQIPFLMSVMDHNHATADLDVQITIIIPAD